MLRPQLKNGMDSAWLLCQSLKEARVSKGIELIQLDFCLQSCLAKAVTDTEEPNNFLKTWTLEQTLGSCVMSRKLTGNFN